MDSVLYSFISLVLAITAISNVYIYITLPTKCEIIWMDISNKYVYLNIYGLRKLKWIKSLDFSFAWSACEFHCVLKVESKFLSDTLFISENHECVWNIKPKSFYLQNESQIISV